MSIHVGKYLQDYYSWGLSHSLFHRSQIHGYEFIDIQLNSSNNNDPPTIKAYSAFHVWKSNTVSVSTNAVGNNVFPATTTVSDWQAEAIFESADRVFTWNSTDLTRSSTGTNGTYWLYCSGGQDISSTSIGLGIYGVATSYTFNFGSSYGNLPYSTNGLRGLASFTMTSNTLSNLTVYNKIQRNFVKEVSTAYTITINDCVIIAKTTSITLPTVGTGRGLPIYIKRASSNGCIIYGQIDNTTSITLVTNYDAYALVEGSTAWYIF
jgi:hypothetical protein